MITIDKAWDFIGTGNMVWKPVRKDDIQALKQTNGISKIVFGLQVEGEAYIIS